MLSQARYSFLIAALGFSLFSCSSGDSSDAKQFDTGSQDSRDIIFEIDSDTSEHDIYNPDTYNPLEDTHEIEENTDDTDDHIHSIQNLQLRSLESLVYLSWDLPENSEITDLQISASPAALMWGESERSVDANDAEFLFDKLVNDIRYTFEIQALVDDEPVGEKVSLSATPYSRPLLAISTHSPYSIIDSVTQEFARGWEATIGEYNGVFSWSPDGTKVLVKLSEEDPRCALFDRATRSEITLNPSPEFRSNFCSPYRESWSPDSKYLVFTRLPIETGLPEPPTLVFSILNTQTGTIERDWPSLWDPTRPYMLVNALGWSPDGTRLAIIINYSTVPARLFIINTATKQIESGWPDSSELYLGRFVWDLSWSPDSKRLAITHSIGSGYGFEPDYVILNAERKEIEQNWPEKLVPAPHRVRWSPDGDLLTITSIQRPGASIQVINTSTHENEVGWPTEWMGIQSIGWSHDSEFLAIGSVESPYLFVLNREFKNVEEGWVSVAHPVEGVNWSPQFAPPDAPSELMLARDPSRATITWEAPDAPQILDYRITIEPADQVDGPTDYLILDASATEQQIEGLDPEVDYSVSIQAITVFGVGEAATAIASAD